MMEINVKKVVFPIYFKRKIRKATHRFNYHPFVKRIIAIGEEPYENRCGGAVICEKTKIYYNDNTIKTIKTKKEFNFLYPHVIEKSFCIKEN